MKFFRREEAIRQMNFLGAQPKPFLFVIDYAMEHSYVNLLDEIPEEEVAHLQSSVFKLSKDLIDSIYEEGIVAYTS